MQHRLIKAFVLLILVSFFNNYAIGQQVDKTKEMNQKNLVLYPEEKHLKNVKQLTFGGDNAEAYFSFDNKMLTFQARNEIWGNACDQIYLADLSKGPIRVMPPLLSTGKGRTTCSYFLPGNQSILYGSTHLMQDSCPPNPEKRKDGKYVWAIYKDFDIFTADLKGNILKRLTDTPGYDAEGTVSPKGDKIVFTSMRSGDLELYIMNIDGTDVHQVTFQLIPFPLSRKLITRRMALSMAPLPMGTPRRRNRA